MDVGRLPLGAFSKVDERPDALFYAEPRFVTHVDDGAIAAVTQTYRDTIAAGCDVFDLMSSWISHMPVEIAYGRVTGHGMNALELAANPRLTEWFVRDLNADPTLPLADAAFDAVCLCCSVQYLQRPVEVFTEVLRVLRPGGPFVVSFSNRCFPTKAVAIWRALPGTEQQRLVAGYMRAAGFAGVSGRNWMPGAPVGADGLVIGDPVWVVIGTA